VFAYYGVLLMTLMTAFYVAWGDHKRGKRRGRAKRQLHTSLCLFFVPKYSPA
jgi:hypothetical protein